MVQMTARAVLVLLAYLAVSCSQGKQSPLDNTRLKKHPSITGGLTIEAEAELLTLDIDDALFKDGRPTTLKDVAALNPAQDRNLDPVLIEVPPDATAARCTPLLSALIVKAGRRNVAFLVSSPSGHRALTLPVLQDHRHGLSLSYTVGRVDHHVDETTAEERRHIWLSLRVTGPGQIRVVEILKKRFNEIWFPDQEPPGTPDPRLWTGSHPALGPWSFGQLKTFLEDLKHKKLAAYCDLQVVPNDRVEDFLKCLDSLNQVAESRTIVSFIVP